jgi:hypothetical protein
MGDLTQRSRVPKGTDAGGQFAASTNPEATVDLARPTDFQENEWVVTPEGRVDRVATIYPPGDADAVTGYRLVHFNDEVYEASHLRRAEGGPEPVKNNDSARRIAEIELQIAKFESCLEELEEQYKDVVDTGSRRENDIDAEIDSCRIEIGGLRDELIEAMREHRRLNPSLKEIILKRAADRLQDEESCNVYGSQDHACECDVPSLGAGEVDLAALAHCFELYVTDNERDFDDAFRGIDKVVENLIDWRLEQKAKKS